MTPEDTSSVRLEIRRFLSVVFGCVVALAVTASAQTTVVPYDCWGNLGFDAGAVNTSYWSANGTAVTFISDGAQAHSGAGALRIDGTAPVSIWGGNVAGSVLPATGDTVGGYFWIKILSAPTTHSVVDVRMTSYDASVNETVYCHSISIDPTEIPLNTWTMISLAPEAVTYDATQTLGFNIVSSGGLDCLIDDVTFGKVTTVPVDPSIVPYDCWDNLGFDAGPVNTSYWSANGTAVSFISDSGQAHTGSGALHIDGTAPISVWGGNVTGSVYPAMGDVVGGYFWIKILSTPATHSMVDVRMTGFDASLNETVYCHSSAIDPVTIPLNTWTKISLTPASATYNASNALDFNILSSGGLDCLIDDVTFGRVISTTTGTVSAAVAVLPAFQPYGGSTFNGNFEVGNATVGNQYWGQYVPNQGAVSGAPNMMNLITNGTGTGAGVVQNGNNMVSITRGGVAWNLANWASLSTDKLPRQGDLVGGYYWLYVPANCDLSLGFPTVSFICQTASGQVTVADSISFGSSNLVKGAWNQIPIYPVAPNNTVTAPIAGKFAGLFVTAPQLNATINPLYQAPFYLDNIQAGSIPVGLCFSPSTSLTDAAGNRIASLSPNDTVLHGGVLIQNSISSAATNLCVVLMLYEQGVLKRSVMQRVTAAGTGPTGVSTTLASISAALDGIDQSKLTAKLYLYDGNLQALLAGPRCLVQHTTGFAPDNANLKYIGRWSGGASGYASDYVRPYFKARFTGSSVAIHLLKSVNLDVTIDGQETYYTGASGLFELASGLSASRTHILKVAGLTYQDLISYDALYLEDGGSLSAPAADSNEIEFIGDSITAWNGGYSWLVPEALGVESSRIAWPGIALVDGFGYYQVTPPLYGMQSAYFKIGMPGYGSGTSGLWNFSRYTPNIIVINLGTNDGQPITGNPTLLGNFQSAYAAFVRAVRTNFPSAHIFVLRAFSIHYADVNTAVSNAAQSVIASGDSRTHYVDTSRWNVEIGPDTIHPTDAGHVAITTNLVPILRPYLSSSAPVFVSGSNATLVAKAPGSFSVQAAGWPAPTFSAISLPAWLSLNPATGVLGGTPAQAGTFSFTLTASNGVGSVATQAFTLTVTAPPVSTFSSWIARYPSVTGTNALAGGNPTHDGIPNLIKYAFGGDPTVAGSVGRPVLGSEWASGVHYLTLNYDRDAGKLDLSYQAQYSTNLASWSAVTNDALAGASGTTEHRTARVPMDEPKKFLRIKVTQEP